MIKKYLNSLDFKKRLIVKLSMIGLLCISAFSLVTFSFIYAIKPQQGVNTIVAGCFGSEYTASSNINITNANSVSDVTGLASTPYTLTIKNTCKRDAESTYYVVVNVKNGSFDSSNLKVSIDGGTPARFNDYESLKLLYNYTPASKYSDYYIIKTGDLTAGSTSTVNVRLWIADDTNYSDVSGKTWSADIKVITLAKTNDPQIQDLSGSGKTLYTLYNENNNIRTDNISVLGTTTDNDGKTYYFKSGTENKLEFAGLSWHILRVNGDGSLRIIADEPLANKSTTNVNYSSSNIKTVLNTWYDTNLKDYSEYIVDSGFCNNQTTGRLPSNPSLECSQSDTYKVFNSKLTKPIGIASADELVLAGMNESNDLDSSHYLNHSSNYATMTKYSDTNIYVGNTKLANAVASTNLDVYPVISLNQKFLDNIIYTGGSFKLIKEAVNNFADDDWRVIKYAAENGLDDRYNIGDVKCVALTGLTHTGDNGNGCSASNEFAVRVANKTACTEDADSETACGFVVEFADVITEQKMNSAGYYKGSNYTSGHIIDGWPGSDMYKYINEIDGFDGSGTIYKALPEDLRNIIIKTNVVSGTYSKTYAQYANPDRSDGNYFSVDKLYLLNPKEVYGGSPSNVNDNNVTRQLDYYAGGYTLNGTITSAITTSNYGTSNKNTPIKKMNGSSKNVWLRSAYTGNSPYYEYISTIGNFSSSYAYNNQGIAPAFRIAGAHKVVSQFNEDSWETIAKNVRSGNTDVYNIGDTKYVRIKQISSASSPLDEGLFRVRIANKDACPAGLDSESACGFVLEFADIITTHNMNPAGELNGTQYNNGWNIGGWPASSMYSYINEVDGNSSSGTIFKALPSDLQDVIIPTHIVSGHGKDDRNTSRTDGNWESDDLLYLLSPVEVYGNNPAPDSTTDNAVSRQLKYYAGGYELNGEETSQITTSNYESTNKNTSIKKKKGSAEVWWMRSVASYYNNTFRYVSSNGSYGNGVSRDSFGLAPAFRIG